MITPIPPKLSASEGRGTHAPGHIVQFYETDDFLTNVLSTFIGTGLQASEVCIVVATKSHIASLEEKLLKQEFDLAAARLHGFYLSIDATATVPQLLVNGELVPGRFAEIVGSKLIAAMQGQQPLRVYGELVALMWADGNRAAAIRLEALWNEWLASYDFELFCAYPLRMCGGEEYEQEFREVCQHHTQVFPTESYATLTDLNECLCTVTLLQQKAASLEVEVAGRKAAQAIERNKDAFIGMASHELKTPITILKTFLGLLQRHERAQGDVKALEYLAHMDAQVDRITQLINDLLDLSRMQVGKLTYREERFAVEALVQEIVENVQGTVSTHQLLLEGLERLKELNGIEMLGDRDRIGQVLINLLTNAIKYSPEADTVIVRVAKTAGRVHVSVRDFGIGIAKEHQQRIFERFYQVNDSGYPGLGIGLAICSEIVKWHEGQLWVESEEGQGTTFHVTLPLAP